MLKIISWVLAAVVIVLAVIAISSIIPHSATSMPPSSQSPITVSTSVSAPSSSAQPAPQPASVPEGTDGTYNTVTIQAGNASIVADVADTEILRQQGLSGRTSLADGKGMWFIFDTAGNYGFWMKDMQFSIDMVWVDSTYNVVTVKSNVSPNTYFDENPPEIFYPTSAAQYVLELPGGYAAAHNIAVGTQVVVQ